MGTYADLKNADTTIQITELILASKGVNMTHCECGNLFGASKSLLEESGLVCYADQRFTWKNCEEDIEKCWKKRFDAEFGRYMAWVWFSVGAENLVKAALVCSGLLKRKDVKLGYPFFSPNRDKATWVDEVMCPNKGAHDQEEAQRFEWVTLDHQDATLGRIWRSEIDKLADVSEGEKRKLKAAYKYLTQVIRNRDAHSYVESQRRKDFPAGEGIFVPAFNVLVETMECNGHFNTITST